MTDEQAREIIGIMQERKDACLCRIRSFPSGKADPDDVAIVHVLTWAIKVVKDVTGYGGESFDEKRKENIKTAEMLREAVSAGMLKTEEAASLWSRCRHKFPEIVKEVAGYEK